MMKERDRVLKRKRHIDIGFDERPDDEDVADICALFLREGSYELAIDWLRRTFGQDFDRERSLKQLANLVEQREIDCRVPQS